MSENCSCGGNLKKMDGDMVCQSCGLKLYPTIRYTDKQRIYSEFKRDYTDEKRLEQVSTVFHTSNRSLEIGLNEINRLKSKIGLSDKVESFAGVIFRKLIEKELLQDKTISMCSQVCIHIASHMVQDIMGTSISEVVNFSLTDTDERQLQNSVDHVADELEVNDSILKS